jgi:hypothetical protein
MEMDFTMAVGRFVFTVSPFQGFITIHFYVFYNTVIPSGLKPECQYFEEQILPYLFNQPKAGKTDVYFLKR